MSRVLSLGPAIAGWFDFRTDFALAQFKGTVAELVQHLQSELAGIDEAKPLPPQAS